MGLELDCGDGCCSLCYICCPTSDGRRREERHANKICLVCCFCCLNESIFDQYSSKTLEGFLSLTLIANIGLIIYLLAQIGLSYISPYTITLIFIILIAFVICFIFIFFFYYWRKSGKIQTSKKGAATTMAKIAFFLIILCLITSGISEYLVITDTQNEKCKEIEKRDKEDINGNAYLRRKYDICQEKFKDTNSKATFSTFSLIECICIINLMLFCAIKKRITLGIYFERPIEEGIIIPNQFQVYYPGNINPGYPQTQAIAYQQENGMPQNPVIIVQPQQLYTYQQNVNVNQYPNNKNEKINNIPQNQIIYNNKKVGKKKKNNIGNNATIENNQNSVQSSSQRNIKGKFV